MVNKVNKFIYDLNCLLVLRKNYMSIFSEEYDYYIEFKEIFLKEWLKELKTYEKDTKDFLK